MSKTPLSFFVLAGLCGMLSASEGSHPEKPDKEAAAPRSHATAGKDGENTPQLKPKPDTAFASAVDWNDGTAEILAYAVKRNGKGGEYAGQGKLVTERMILHANGLADRKASGKEDVEILNALLACAGEESGVPFSDQTIVKLARRDGLKMMRQDQSLQTWPGAAYRSLDCRAVPPRMHIVSSGGEEARDSVLTRWPVYTEAMLFTYLRAVPLRAGYQEEVWFQDWAGEGRMVVRPQFASISVHSKVSNIRDMEAWYLTVDRDDGRRSEFWVSSSGLHPVVQAILADRSEWALLGMSRRKY